MSIKNYNDFTNEEVGWVKNILLSSLLSLGISKSQAQLIKDDQKKLAIINCVDLYNRNPRGLEDLKLSLSKNVDDPNKLVGKYLQLNPDRTVTIKKIFINNMIFDVNLFTRAIKFTYRIKF